MTRQSRADKLGEVVGGLIAYRGWTSPEKLDSSYRARGEAPPVGAATIRRIMGGTWSQLDSDEGDLALIRLAGMLKVPPRTLTLVAQGDPNGVERLEFAEPEVRQFVIDFMEPPAPPRKRRAAGA
jgi:hypothetical protein